MTVMIRTFFLRATGKIEDSHENYDLSDFAGFLPSIGDTILNPGVVQGLNRSDPVNRRIWTVVGRMFNPLDNKDGVALIVEERAPTGNETELVP